MLIQKNCRQFLRDQHGSTAVEYTIIASAMGMATLASMALLGPTVGDLYNLMGSFFS